MKSSVVFSFVRSANNYDTMAASNESGLFCDDPSLTQQQFRDDADINKIVDTFTRTGVLPAATVSPQFGDFSGVSDFHSALNQVIAAQEDFQRLPAQLRSRFNNDPAALIDFLQDEGNRAEAVKLGIVPPKEDLSPALEVPPRGKPTGAGGKSGQKLLSSVPASNEGGEGE